ncbi:hypothetical protein ACTEV4_000635 [Cronobacter turicensis]
MAAFGIQTWDALGIPNNYGIQPISVLGYIQMGLNQQTGGATFQLPSGMVMDFMTVNFDGSYTQTRRTITVSGGNLSVGSAANNNYATNTYPATAGYIVAFLRKP